MFSIKTLVYCLSLFVFAQNETALLSLSSFSIDNRRFYTERLNAETVDSVRVDVSLRFLNDDQKGPLYKETEIVGIREYKDGKCFTRRVSSMPKCFVQELKTIIPQYQNRVISDANNHMVPISGAAFVVTLFFYPSKQP